MSSIDDITASYRGGHRSPVEVVSASLAAIAQSDVDDPPLRAIILPIDHTARREAEASTQRWKTAEPLSPLDGVPYVIKDNTDIAGQPTTAGSVIPLPIPQTDAWVVDRLRKAGAICVGKANMHEIGAGTTGINPHHGTPRNAWDDRRWCGGSSSGSASAVGAGLVPLSVGTDAGGSIRAPASFVGAVGLKPTFGRISRVGMAILCDTLDHLGPIATSCRDAALAYVAMAGVNPDDDETWDQPALPAYDEIDGLLAASVKGLRIGIAPRSLDSHLIHPGVAAHVKRAAAILVDAGAELVQVELPDAERSLFIGLVLLGAEGPSGLEYLIDEHLDRLGADFQIMWRIGAHFTARDYLKAQRIRNQIRAEWSSIFQEIDLMVHASAGFPAGIIHADALLTGELDEATSQRAIAQTFPSNLTGYPAVSVPSGLVDGMPAGVQLIARPWDEMLTLRAGATLERAGLFDAGRPPRWYGT